MLSSGKQPLKAFISYKWEDEAHNNWVKKLATDLRKACIEAHIDRWEVRLGESFVEYMRSRIREADVVLFIITEASVKAVESPKGEGGALKFEYEMARAQAISGKSRLIGIYREGSKTPADLSHYRYADFRDDSKYEQNLRELVADLLDEIDVPPVAKPLVTDMVLIPAGEFQMGSKDGRDDEKPVHTVYLDAFYMDKYEVTNAQYRKFVRETGHREPTGYGYVNGKWQDGFKPWSDPNFNGDNQPVVCVDWKDANAYAQWAGKRLPTEAEWEKAARGGSTGRKYVWGDSDSPPQGAGNFADESAKRKYPNWTIFGGYNDGYAETAPVGSFSPNGYGLYDMAGNVLEWCSDWYDSSYYANSPKRNPTGPVSGIYRILRGGSWFSDPVFLRVADRSVFDPSYVGDDFGFRCCASRSD